ncbi:MAG TPA: HEAT repeat domain-containing protein [Planctomycetota bacterium]|nr:HEAT repeat domain-containing protein [Planctomycetota bacterium]
MEWLRTPRGQVLFGSGLVTLAALGIIGYVLLAGSRADARPNVPPLLKIGKTRAEDVPGLDHADPVVRLKAARKIRETLDPNSARVLFGLLSDRDERVRLAAAEELAALKDRSVLAEVLRMLNRGAAEEQRVASIVLSGLASDEEQKEIYHLRNDPDPLKRRAAARAIANMKDKAYWQTIVPSMLRDKDGSVRFEAAKTVKTSFPEAWSIPVYEKILKESAGDPEVRRSAIIGLGMIASPQALEALGTWFKEEQDPELRKDILSQAAAQLPGEASRKLIDAARTADGSELVREHADALLQRMNK